ncbi:MAG: hypothetical protein WA087_03525 [Candidatus Saccharimonadales bacterium]
MAGALKKTLGHFARNIFVNPINNRTRKRAISKFAEKRGLRYIGFVDQHAGTHTVVRGFTVSSSHEDNHYCSGLINGREVLFVDRVDAVWTRDNTTEKHNWMVMSFRLTSKNDVPHIFLNAKNHDSKAFSKLFSSAPTMNEVELGAIESYSNEFTSRFKMFTQPSAFVTVERLLPARAAMVLAAHLWPLSVEIIDNVIYVYADNKQATPNLLDTMLKCGLWLADYIDQQAENTI